jgi:hypothetical protein
VHVSNKVQEWMVRMHLLFWDSWEFVRMDFACFHTFFYRKKPFNFYLTFIKPSIEKALMVNQSYKWLYVLK